jgi:hypothetical protein
LAKHIFQIHGVDAAGECVLRKRLRRGQVVTFFARLPRCLVGLELQRRIDCGLLMTAACCRRC